MKLLDVRSSTEELSSSYKRHDFATVLLRALVSHPSSENVFLRLAGSSRYILYFLFAIITLEKGITVAQLTGMDFSFMVSMSCRMSSASEGIAISLLLFSLTFPFAYSFRIISSVAFKTFEKIFFGKLVYEV